MKRIRQNNTPRALGALALAGATGLLASSLVAYPQGQEPQDSKVELTRAAMEKYVTLRGAIGKEKARLAEDSWVASASLRREWPDTLRVMVEPEVPVARWRDEALLSNRGRIIAPLWDNAPGTLPSLSGPEGSAPQLMATYLRVAEMLQGHQLTVARVEESAAGDIEVTLQGGVRLRLGTDAQVARLRRVDAVLSAALAAQLDRVDSIDARYDNGVAVAWREGAAGKRILALRDQRLGKER